MKLKLVPFLYSRCSFRYLSVLLKLSFEFLPNKALCVCVCLSYGVCVCVCVQGRSAAQFVRCVRRARARERKKEGRLKELGVDYQLPARTGVGEPKHTHFTSN